MALHTQLDKFLHQTHQHLIWVGVYRCLLVVVEDIGELPVLVEVRIAHMHALGDRQNLKTSLDVFTGTFSIFSNIMYALIDPGSTLSYVTPLIAGKFKRTP